MANADLQQRKSLLYGMGYVATIQPFWRGPNTAGDALRVLRASSVHCAQVLHVGVLPILNPMTQCCCIMCYGLSCFLLTIFACCYATNGCITHTMS